MARAIAFTSLEGGPSKHLFGRGVSSAERTRYGGDDVSLILVTYRPPRFDSALLVPLR
jgi:hypothetical protein